MDTNKDNGFLFSNESMIFRIVSMAKIVSWVMLGLYAIVFINSLVGIFQGQTRWPAQPWAVLLTLADLFFAPALGLFYFLVLQGVAHGLNLGLDLYYDFQPDEEEEDVEEGVDDEELEL